MYRFERTVFDRYCPDLDSLTTPQRNEACAYCTPWGVGQIMSFHYPAVCQYGTRDFITWMERDDKHAWIATLEFLNSIPARSPLPCRSTIWRT